MSLSVTVAVALALLGTVTAFPRPPLSPLMTLVRFRRVPSSMNVVSSTSSFLSLAPWLTARFVGLLRRELDTISTSATASMNPMQAVIQFLVNRTASFTPSSVEAGTLAPAFRAAAGASRQGLLIPHENLTALAQAVMAADDNPLLCFVNGKSGGQTGAALLTKLGPVLCSAQLCDLSQNAPATYLNLYAACPRLRVLVCGGDGSVAWVMDEVKRAFPAHNCACTFGILPLGTGNDLCLQLTTTRAALAVDAAAAVAAGASGDAAASAASVTAVAPRTLLSDPTKIVGAYASPDVLLLDRWAVEVRRVYGRRRKLLKLALMRTRVAHRGRGVLGAIAAFLSRFWGFGVGRRVALLGPPPPPPTAATVAAAAAAVSAAAVAQTVFVPAKPQKGELTTFTMNNYFGVGVDGAVSLGFHRMRQRAPGLFFNRWVNKLWYGIIGAVALLLGWSNDLSACCQLSCDGEVVPIPAGTQGIIVLNVNSYAGGSTMWTPSPQALRSGQYRPADVSDGLLEVVAVSGEPPLAAWT